MIDACKAKVKFETGEKGWLDDLVVKTNYEPHLSCFVRAPASEPMTYGLVPGSAQGGWSRWRTLGVGRTDTQAVSPSHRLHQTKAPIRPCHVDFFPHQSGHVM